MKGMIFQNSKGYINEGGDHGKGLLYCGNNYTGEGGCPCGSCDGYCGTDTDNAIRAFQNDHGLEVDGYVGPATFLELF